MRIPQSCTLIRAGAALLIAVTLWLVPASTRAAETPWNGEYFANVELAGKPALVRPDNDLNFDWKLGAAAPSLPADHFSARWTRTVSLAAGQWLFNATVDDGVRVYVDGQAVIDQWRITAPVTYTSSVTLGGGTHTVRVEYYENTERAQIRVWWTQDGGLPQPAPLPSHAGNWRGQYFDNRDLSGDPAMERDDQAVYFDWGEGGPGGGIGGHDFSARWTRTLQFPNGTYRFKIKADDGVRVWLDWVAIIDEWHDAAGRTYERELEVSEGKHTIVVEYYQGGGNARINVTWQNTSVDWIGNLITCMRAEGSWVKVYRLAPSYQWEDLKSAGYGPTAANGELKLWGVPVDASFGWDGQPYMVELWIDGRMVASEGNIFAGQPALRIMPGQDVHTSWDCGAALPH